MADNLEIEFQRSPNLDGAEVHRRLASAYRLILEAAHQKQAKEDELPEKVKQEGDVL